MYSAKCKYGYKLRILSSTVQRWTLAHGHLRIIYDEGQHTSNKVLGPLYRANSLDPAINRDMAFQEGDEMRIYSRFKCAVVSVSGADMEIARIQL